MENEEIHLQPIMEYQGHFHIDLSSETPVIEQVGEIISMILTEMKISNTSWDEAQEIWMVHTGWYEEGMHQEKWPECIYKNDPNMKPFDPFRIIEFGNVHPVDFLHNCVPAPEESGVFLLAESWSLSEEDMEEGQSYKDWIGRVADHPKAKEIRNLTYCSDIGEFIMGAYCRTDSPDKEIMINISSVDDPPAGRVPEALLEFTGNAPKKETWQKRLGRNLS
jgi:hypothetical protein